MIWITTPVQAFTLPDDRDDALRQLLTDMTLCTTSWHQRMYGFTHPDIANGMIAMQKRGVDVKLLLDHSQSADPPEAKLLHTMISSGFPVGNICITTSMMHEIMHTKEAVYDGLMVIEGSLNFSPSAFKQDNTLLFLGSPELAADVETRFQTEWAWAREQEARYQLAGS